MRTVVLLCAFFASGIWACAQAALSASADTASTVQAPQTTKINMLGSARFEADHSAISSPKLKKKVEPEFPEQARKDRFEGVVNVRMVVDNTGTPRNVRVVAPIGHGLDEAAMNAVKRWRFEPAKKDGQPVAVLLNVEVSFHL